MGIGTRIVAIPHIMGLINEGLKAEVDRIANNAIAQSYLPMVTELLAGIQKELKLSEILQKLKEGVRYTYDGCINVFIEKDSQHSWYNMKVEMDKACYSITLHEKHDKKGKYQILGMPYKKGSSRTMRLYYDEHKCLELPMEMNVLHDEVALLCAKLLIANTEITIDVEGEHYFDDEDCD